ncbi:MAG TPA: hypothetical protein DGD08_15195 [Gemmatimonas aurantiaca]|uniref:Uncharacterized protein n=2 Tax=Gemmatimonas aurantiaca TaxID=173480 RepID=C1A5K7_GEMAT|nr:hypothetical protein [Gemmatimonas aurantiaca]BAH37517.1 hypothetical protein GAU_0475 [Gemmatimonas aurantiaca T-27]HCT58549.1 hypothetical protein [Gemmatimonas aurantiaca]
MQHRNEAHDELDVTRGLPRDIAPQADRPLADREVPLPGLGASTGGADVIHQWLDGEAAEADARRADARQVEFWKRVDQDTDRMRRMKTPAHVAASIMAALPPKQVEAQMATATATATVAQLSANTPEATSTSFGRSAIVGAIMLAIGIVIGRMVL